MAKPITSTPVIKGKDAVRIAHEIKHGTPNTPARERIIRESDCVYAHQTNIQGQVRVSR